MNGTDEEQIAHARQQEDPNVGKALSLSVLESAVAKGDIHLEARALTCLAECENLLSNYRVSYERSSQAVRLFQSVGDFSEEAKALAELAYAASALGRNDEAVEAALLGLELAKRSGDADRQADAQVKLGVALFYSKCFEASNQALREASRLGRACATAQNELFALVTQGCCEVYRVVTLRHESDEMPSLANLESLLAQFDEFAASHDMNALAQPDQAPLQVLWRLVSSAAKCWLGDLSRSRGELDSVRAWMDEMKIAPWMESLEALVQCELAQANADWLLAEQQAARLVEMAELSGREQAAVLGHVLACRVFQLQGKHALALDELKQLAARERRIRSESLATRDTVVAWQLDMRRIEASRRDLQASADRLAKLSLEDPLTGIANRRCFDNVAAESLRESLLTGRPLCLALIDVDRFKQVNDTHSHLVGDKVLQVIAALLSQHVREDDLAARLAGDEFVLVLRRVNQARAVEASERLRSAVATYAWGSIAPGLAVTISIGVAQSRPGDTLETLLHRSDAAMYEGKASSKTGST